MPATIRDLLKPAPWRKAEVFQLNQYKAGQANSQYVDFGAQLAVGTTNTTLGITVGRIVIAQSIVTVPAQATGIALTGCTTGAGQFMNALVEIAADGATVTVTPGTIAGSAAAASIPALTASRLALGYVAIPASFTPGTTAVTAGMLNNFPYDAGFVYQGS